MPIFSLCICFAGNMIAAMQNDRAGDHERATMSFLRDPPGLWWGCIG
jgi:hypothetical protein